MKKILIVNLRRIGDVYMTAHLISSLKNNNDCEISILTYKENKKAAVNLKNITNLYFIDRHELITILKNKLFSDAFAMEQLYSQLNEIKETNFTTILNYSNDLVSTNICSYLKKTGQNIVGIHYDNSRNIFHDSDWSILFNEIIPVISQSPIHFIDCYHQMMQVEYSTENNKIITNEKYNISAHEKIKQIKEHFQGNDQIKIIGIQLKSSSEKKDIPENILVNLLKFISKNESYVPVLLIGPFENERKLADEINAQLEEEVIIVESNLEAVSSVLINTDLLITPDTSIKHIANLTRTPVLEISIGNNSLLKQGSYDKNTLILTDCLDNSNKYETTQISAQDIFSTINYFFSKTKSTKPVLSSNICLYKGDVDKLGVYYRPISGNFNINSEIQRGISRQILLSTFNSDESYEIYNFILSLGINEVQEWLSNEKNLITKISKDLLGTLRSLLQSIESKKCTKDFVINLGRLISHAEENSSIQISLNLFKYKIENISAITFSENAKRAEIILYELKNDIQKILQCFGKLEEVLNRQKKIDFMKKPSEQSLIKEAKNESI